MRHLAAWWLAIVADLSADLLDNLRRFGLDEPIERTVEWLIARLDRSPTASTRRRIRRYSARNERVCNRHERRLLRRRVG